MLYIQKCEIWTEQGGVDVCIRERCSLLWHWSYYIPEELVCMAWQYKRPTQCLCWPSKANHHDMTSCTQFVPWCMLLRKHAWKCHSSVFIMEMIIESCGLTTHFHTRDWQWKRQSFRVGWPVSWSCDWPKTLRNVDCKSCDYFVTTWQACCNMFKV